MNPADYHLVKEAEHNIPMSLPSVAFKSGFIALIGRPNSGKSTLLNRVLEQELSVVTPLPQTTRRNLRGIYTTDSMQLVFLDTPGIHQGKYAVNDSMVHEARSATEKGGVDCVAYLVDCSREIGEEETVVAGIARAAKVPVIIVFNKMDQCDDFEKKKAAFNARFPEFALSPSLLISAKQASAKDQFIAAIMPFIKEGPLYYDTATVTDANMRFFAAELIRKHIILNTREEVPHAVFVEIEQYQESETYHRVGAVIHVETIGQKGIIIGKKGALITKIRAAAERDLAQLAGCPVSISCHLQVTPEWRNNQHFLKNEFMV